MVCVYKIQDIRKESIMRRNYKKLEMDVMHGEPGKKKNYQGLELEIILFDAPDIITASDGCPAHKWA